MTRVYMCEAADDKTPLYVCWIQKSGLPIWSGIMHKRYRGGGPMLFPSPLTQRMKCLLLFEACPYWEMCRNMAD